MHELVRIWRQREYPGNQNKEDSDEEKQRRPVKKGKASIVKCFSEGLDLESTRWLMSLWRAISPVVGALQMVVG